MEKQQAEEAKSSLFSDIQNFSKDNLSHTTTVEHQIPVVHPWKD